MARAKTQLQKDYQKQVERIMRFIRRGEKRGYIFEQDIIPPKPARITAKRVAELKAITPTKLYARARFKSPETRESLSGYEARQRERERAAKKGAETRRAKSAGELPRIDTEIIIRVRKTLESFIPDSRWSDYYAKGKERLKNQLEEWFNSYIDKDGEIAISRRLQSKSADWEHLVERVMYDSEGKYDVKENMALFFRTVKGHQLSNFENAEITKLSEI